MTDFKLGDRVLWQRTMQVCDVDAVNDRVCVYEAGSIGGQHWNVPSAELVAVPKPMSEVGKKVRHRSSRVVYLVVPEGMVNLATQAFVPISDAWIRDNVTSEHYDLVD